MPKDQNGKKEWRIAANKDDVPVVVCAEFATDKNRKLEIIEKNGKTVKIAKELLDGTIKVVRNRTTAPKIENDIGEHRGN